MVYSADRSFVKDFDLLRLPLMRSFLATVAVTFLLPGLARASVQVDSLAPEEAPPALVRAQPQEIAELSPKATLKDLKQALSRQRAQCQDSPPRGELRLEETDGSIRRVSAPANCLKTTQVLLSLLMKAPSIEAFWEQLKGPNSPMDWYRTRGSDGQGKVLFTGYYFPKLAARLAPDAQYRYPLYARPPEVTLTTIGGQPAWRKKQPDGSFTLFDTREQIDVGGSLKGRGLELAWVADPFEAFIFHVQGSGVLELTDTKSGKKTRMILNFDGQNGHPYRSIRGVLQAQGVAEEYLTVPGMKRYFALNPEALRPTLNANPSYVFFKRSLEGPYGAGKVLLTPWHSVAADLRLYPVGTFGVARTHSPVRTPDPGEPIEWQEQDRLVVVQDTGGAIRGAGRIDFYYGEGPLAEEAAGTKAHDGTWLVGVAR